MHCLTLAILLWVPCAAIGQTDSLAMKVITGAENRELYDLMSFQGISQSKIILRSPALPGKKIYLGFDEYKNGKVISKGKLTQGLPDKFYQAATDTFLIKILTQEKGDSVKINSYFPRFNTSTYFHLQPPVEEYSLQLARSINGDSIIYSLEPSKKIPVLVYTLPYQKEGDLGKYYCALRADEIPPEKWWEHYGVKHYIIFYIEVV